MARLSGPHAFRLGKPIQPRAPGPISESRRVQRNMVLFLFVEVARVLSGEPLDIGKRNAPLLDVEIKPSHHLVPNMAGKAKRHRLIDSREDHVRAPGHPAGERRRAKIRRLDDLRRSNPDIPPRLGGYSRNRKNYRT